MTKGNRLFLRFLKLLYSRFIFSIFRRTQVPYYDFPFVDPRLSSGEHNCALVALSKVMPSLASDRIIKGFSDCCDGWPYAGVTNKEFNITLRHLGLYDQFQYDDSDGMVLNDFLAESKRKDIFILLLHGHFTVVKYGRVSDSIFYRKLCDAKVYCSWRLISDSFS